MKYFLILAGLLVTLCTASAQTSPPETRERQDRQRNAGNQVLRSVSLNTPYLWRGWTGNAGSNGSDLARGGKRCHCFPHQCGFDDRWLAVPKGDYTLYVNVKDPDAWDLIINKQTGQWGTSYDASQDLGRVKMQMSKPPALIEMLKYTISSAGGNKGTIQLAWEKHIASVAVTAK